MRRIVVTLSRSCIITRSRITHDIYFVNNSTSLWYMLGLYVRAIVVYVASRVIRRREGIDLDRINAEIPVE